MSYESMNNLSQDQDFKDRVFTCCLEQALIFQNDGRYSIAQLGKQIILAPQFAEGVFQLVCVMPNVADVTDQTTITDLNILGMVQAKWMDYAPLAFPEPEESPA